MRVPFRRVCIVSDQAGFGFPTMTVSFAVIVRYSYSMALLAGAVKHC